MKNFDNFCDNLDNAFGDENIFQEEVNDYFDHSIKYKQ